jgi:hypothetical protein
MRAYAGTALVGGAIVIGILNNWRTGVYFFLSWLLFEDFARKFLGNNMAIYFVKDFLALVVFISFLAAARRKEVASFRPPFLGPVLIFMWFGLLQVFNPASTSIWYGLMGFSIVYRPSLALLALTGPIQCLSALAATRISQWWPGCWPWDSAATSAAKGEGEHSPL